MSTEELVQNAIREAKEILAKESAENFMSFIEKKASDLEKDEHILESIILWHFVSETMEKFDESDYLAYAYSKLISRYLFVENLSKAEEMYKESTEKNLSSFHLDTVKSIFDGRKEVKDKREIVEISKMDVFGDLELIPASPSNYFDSMPLIRRYIHNNLPAGTFSVVIVNHKNNSQEKIEISTETLSEYEVISINEKVRVD